MCSVVSGGGDRRRVMTLMEVVGAGHTVWVGGSLGGKTWASKGCL